MAPQTSIPVVCIPSPLLITNTSFWIWTNYRAKKTDGLPGIMMFLWAVCAVPFGAYSIAQNFNIPIQVQPQVFGTLCLVSWAQTLIYHDRWPAWKASSIAGAIWLVLCGAEAALILTLKPLYDRGINFPMIILGVIASILLAVGLLPPYIEIYKRRGRVIGINWIFLTIDWMGAFFSLMALVAQNTFDILGGILYILCVFIEGGIFISHLIWRFRTRKIRAQAKAEEKTFDDIAEERRRENVEFQFAEREVKLPFFRSKPGGPGPMEAGNMKEAPSKTRSSLENAVEMQPGELKS
ncbi:PQ-loop domain containing protein [Hyaloscypha variabilis]